MAFWLVNWKLKLTCTVEGVPEPDIQWEKDGVTVTNENFPNVIFAKDSLLLSGVSREDEGTWTCIASNIAGSDSISHQLLIEWAPKVRIRTSSWKGQLEIELWCFKLDRSARIGKLSITLIIPYKIGWIDWDRLKQSREVGNFQIVVKLSNYRDKFRTWANISKFRRNFSTFFNFSHFWLFNFKLFKLLVFASLPFPLYVSNIESYWWKEKGANSKIIFSTIWPKWIKYYTRQQLGKILFSTVPSMRILNPVSNGFSKIIKLILLRNRSVWTNWPVSWLLKMLLYLMKERIHGRYNWNRASKTKNDQVRGSLIRRIHVSCI